jgi:hypothetical protein
MNITEKKNTKKEWLKNNCFVIFLILFGLLLIGLGISAPIIFNRPAPEWLSDRYILKDYNEISQSFGNYFAPFIGLLGVFLTFAAFYIQYRANLQVQKQFRFQKTSDHFYKMLDIHIANVSEMEIVSYYRDNQKEYKLNNNNFSSFEKSINHIIRPNQKEQNSQDFSKDKFVKKICSQEIKSKRDEFTIEKIYGRRVFILMEKDLHLSIELISAINKNCLEERLDSEMITRLAYKIFFWGTNSSHIGGGNEENKDREFIRKTLNHIREQFRNNKGAKYSFGYKTNEEKRNVSMRFIPFSGHSSRLAHYYRHLYQTVRFLDESFKNNLITSHELKSNLKTLRAQLMNEEVLMLYYNFIIGFGHNWERNDKEYNHTFFTDYGMIHNIPLRDNVHKLVKNPIKQFNTYISKMKSMDKSYRMFEWDEGPIV